MSNDEYARKNLTDLFAGLLNDKPMDTVLGLDSIT